MERDPSQEKPRFQIGRWTTHNFEVYETASTEEEAVFKFRKMIAGGNPVSNPEEIRIFEKDGSSPRKDLEDKAGSK